MAIWEDHIGTEITNHLKGNGNNYRFRGNGGNISWNNRNQEQQSIHNEKLNNKSRIHGGHELKENWQNPTKHLTKI